MRLGDLDALKEALKEEIKFGGNKIYEFDKGYDIGIEKAIEMLDNAPTIMPKEFEPLVEAIMDALPAIVEKTVPAVVEKIERIGEWIPVSEGLPNQYDRILVTIHVPTRKPVVRSGFYHDGLFHIDNGDCWKVTDMEIVAWMPMPEPYKEGKE